MSTLSRAAFALFTVCMLLQHSPAAAQWKWRDAQGRVQYSDRPPPSDVPDKDILSRPAAALVRLVPTDGKGSEDAKTSTPAASEPAGKEVSSRRKLEAMEAEKQREVERKNAEARAENCRRAQSQMRLYEDGTRIVRANAKGEREVLNDAQRDEEIKRTRAIIASDCGR
ncbi:DUF4124 domain-containing protein [Roseateles sp. BYS180W]|uniref:DUF4124 domain-containing protein n=1 Tax=Roseateles rivi TaxID=3299028 RepID=A0ABW7FZ68_9BURK